MTIYTHWTEDTAKGELKRHWFGRREQQQACARAARKEGLQVLAEGEYHVEPNATAVAAFLNERCCVCPSDLAEEYVNTVVLGVGQ